MHILLSPFVNKELQRIKHKDKKLIEKIEKQLFLFQSNPKHPSLRVHKLTGKKEFAWSISITMSLRMVYQLVDDNTAYFIDIGTHDEVYRK
jgi:addiction module RelE/StbE family toxin